MISSNSVINHNLATLIPADCFCDLFLGDLLTIYPGSSQVMAGHRDTEVALSVLSSMQMRQCEKKVALQHREGRYDHPRNALRSASERARDLIAW